MKPFAVLILYIAMGFALYSHTLDYGFLLDDHVQILNNPQVLDSSKIFLNFTNSTVASENGISGVYYKPMMMVIYNVLWNGGGGSAVPFHVFQLLMHIANAFLLFMIFQKFFTDDRRMWSTLLGFLFLIHPINSEAVLMIADLQENMFLFFGLSGLLVLTRQKFAWASTVLFLLSLLCKESGVLFILIAPFYCYLLQRARFKMAIAAVISSLVIYMGLRLGLTELHSLHAQNMQINRADLLTRLQTLPKILTHYLHVFLALDKPSLTQDWVVSERTFKDFWAPLVEVLVLTGFLLVYTLKRHRKEFLFLVAWLVLGLGIHSQIIPLDGTVSDRWFYFPIIGLLGICLWLIRYELGAPKRIKFVFIAVISLTWSLSTLARTQFWKTPMALYKEDLRSDPNSFYLNNNVGLELITARQFQEAIPYLEKTIANSPPKSTEWLVGYRNLGAAYYEFGNLPKAEECFRTAFADPDVRSYRAMVMVLAAQGKHDEAKAYQVEGLKHYPGDAVLLRYQK